MKFTIKNERHSPNFEYFIKAKKLKVGDEWMSYEFTSWIVEMHGKFQKEVYGEYHLTTTSGTEEYYTAFHKWLDEEIEKEAQDETKD